MKIQNNAYVKMNAYQKQAADHTKAKDAQKKNDRVEISNTAKMMQQDSQFDISRKEKVAEIKAQVENGQYTVDPHKVAEKMARFWQK